MAALGLCQPPGRSSLATLPLPPNRSQHCDVASSHRRRGGGGVVHARSHRESEDTRVHARVYAVIYAEYLFVLICALPPSIPGDRTTWTKIPESNEKLKCFKRQNCFSRQTHTHILTLTLSERKIIACRA